MISGYNTHEETQLASVMLNARVPQSLKVSRSHLEFRDVYQQSVAAPLIVCDSRGGKGGRNGEGGGMESRACLIEHGSYFCHGEIWGLELCKRAIRALQAFLWHGLDKRLQQHEL